MAPASCARAGRGFDMDMGLGSLRVRGGLGFGPFRPGDFATQQGVRCVKCASRLYAAAISPSECVFFASTALSACCPSFWVVLDAHAVTVLHIMTWHIPQVCAADSVLQTLCRPRCGSSMPHARLCYLPAHYNFT